MGWLPVIVANGFLWTGSMLLIDVFGQRRKRRNLLERSQPYQPMSIAAEAEPWLEEQQG